MSVHQAKVQALGLQSERDITGLWERHLAGEFSEKRFLVLAAAAIARRNRQAVALADVLLAAALMRLLRQPVAPLGLVPNEQAIDQARLASGVSEVLTADVDYVESRQALVLSQTARLARMARAEPLTTAQDATQDALQQRETGWVRETDPTPCPLCRGWADGKVRGPNVRMARHTGCSCVQRPAV